MAQWTCTTQAFVFWVDFVLGHLSFLGVFGSFMFWGGQGLVREMSTREPAVNLTFVAVEVSAAGSLH